MIQQNKVWPIVLTGYLGVYYLGKLITLLFKYEHTKLYNLLDDSRSKFLFEIVIHPILLPIIQNQVLLKYLVEKYKPENKKAIMNMGLSSTVISSFSGVFFLMACYQIPLSVRLFFILVYVSLTVLNFQILREIIKM